MKVTHPCTIDQDLKSKAKALKINISGLLNQTLRSIISNYADDDIDIFEIERQLDLIRNKIVELKQQESDLISQKVAFEEKRRQQQQTDLKQQVKMAESIKRSGVLHGNH